MRDLVDQGVLPADQAFLATRVGLARSIAETRRLAPLNGARRLPTPLRELIVLDKVVTAVDTEILATTRSEPVETLLRLAAQIGEQAVWLSKPGADWWRGVVSDEWLEAVFESVPAMMLGRGHGSPRWWPRRQPQPALIAHNAVKELRSLKPWLAADDTPEVVGELCIYVLRDKLLSHLEGFDLPYRRAS